MTLIELVTSVVILGLVGAATGAVAGWVGDASIPLSALAGAVGTLFLGTLGLLVAIARSSAAPDDDPPSD